MTRVTLNLVYEPVMKKKTTTKKKKNSMSNMRAA